MMSNPMMLFNQMVPQNYPQMVQMLRMLQGKSPQELRSMAENMAKERGITLEDVARQLGVQLPKN